MSLFLLLLMLLMPYSVSRSLPCLGVLLKVDWWVIWFIFCYEKDIYCWVLYSPFFTVAFNVALCLFLFLSPPPFFSLLILSLSSLSLLLTLYLYISFSLYICILSGGFLITIFVASISFETARVLLEAQRVLYLRTGENTICYARSFHQSQSLLVFLRTLGWYLLHDTIWNVKWKFKKRKTNVTHDTTNKYIFRRTNKQSIYCWINRRDYDLSWDGSYNTRTKMGQCSAFCHCHIMFRRLCWIPYFSRFVVYTVKRFTMLF